MKLCKLKTVFFFVILLFNSELIALENKILFKINNEIITTVDIYNESKYLQLLNPNLKDINNNKIYEISKNSIIREKIKEIELNKHFKILDIDKKYFDQLISNYSQKRGFESVEKFKEFIKENSLDIYVIEKKIKIEVLWNKLIVKKFIRDVKIDKKKIKSELKTNSKQTEYFLSEIVFNIKNKDDLSKKLEIIKKDIGLKGFDSAALIHSISDTSSNGGKLGWIKKSSLSKKIQEQILQTSISELTKPIIIPGGFLILKIVDKRITDRELDLDNEIQSIIDEKTNEQLNRLSITFFNKVKKNIQIYEL